MFDHSWIPRVEEMDSEEKFKAWLESHTITGTPGDSHAMHIPALARFAESISFPVRFNTPLYMMEKPGAMGVCHGDLLTNTGDIYISEAIPSDNDTLRVLTHEIAHAAGAQSFDLGTDECTAEAVAFQVCSELGLDTSAISIPYIATYHWPYSGKLDVSFIDKLTDKILTGASLS